MLFPFEHQQYNYIHHNIPIESRYLLLPWIIDYSNERRLQFEWRHLNDSRRRAIGGALNIS